jgi:hypothetical protein
MEREQALVLSYCRYAPLTTFPPHLNWRENGEGACSGPLVLQVGAFLPTLPEQEEMERELALVLSCCRYASLTTFPTNLNRRGNE